MTQFILLKDVETFDESKTRVNVASIITYLERTSAGRGKAVVHLGGTEHITVYETADEIDQLIRNKSKEEQMIESPVVWRSAPIKARGPFPLPGHRDPRSAPKFAADS